MAKRQSKILNSRRMKRVKRQIKMQVCNLSDVLIEEILSWLPVKSLLRFKCVSKNWCSIISSSYFRNLHLKRLTKQNRPENNALFILSRTPTSWTTYTSNIEAVVAGDPIIHHRAPNENGFDSTNPCFCDNLSISESCNGLFCLRYKLPFPRRWHNVNDDEFVLYNPVTGAFKHLPTLQIPAATKKIFRESLLITSLGFFGLGYDHISDDYKVINVIRSDAQYLGNKPTELHDEMHIFSLRNNCWSEKKLPKGTDDLPTDAFTRDRKYPFALANNALHWISQSRKIFGIDLHSEECRELQGPNLEGDYEIINLDGHGGYLNLTVERRVSTDIDSISTNILDKWRMNKYGERESWNRWVTVQMPNNSPQSYITHHIGTTNRCSKQVEAFVLRYPTQRDKLFYQTPEQNFIKVELNDVSCMTPFVPSLVSFDQ